MTALLATMLAVTLALAYATLTQGATVAATERLERTADQLAGRATASMARIRRALAAAARDSVLRRALEPPTSAAAPAAAPAAAGARAGLARLLPPGDTGVTVELWTEDGRRVAFAGRDVRARGGPESPAGESPDPLRATPGFETLRPADSVQVGTLHVVDGVPYFWVVAPVPSAAGDARAGYLARQYRIAEGPEADRALSALTGAEVTAYYRNADGGTWTTLSGRRAAPPAGRDTTGESLTVTRPGVGTLFAVERPILGTPLVLTLEMPTRSALAEPLAALRRLAVLSLLVLLVGTVAAWLIGRQITHPLVALTGAAHAIARGDYGARVEPAGDEELARLAESFNHMASEVGTARDELETQTEEAQAVAEELEESNAGLGVALRELEERETQFRVLADAIPQLAWMAEPDGSIFWYNERWYAYTGTTPEAMRGSGWQAVHDPAMLPAVLARWRAAIAAGAPFEMQFPLRGADGSYHWFLTQVHPVRDREGRIVRWFGTNTDVHALRDAQEAAERARAQAEAANRAKDEFLAVMSHELRTPLNAIGGYVDLLDLELRGPVTEAQRHDLQRIRASQHHLLGIITSILNHARLDAGHVRYTIRAVRLADVLPALGTLIGPQMRARALDFEVGLCDEGLAVLADHEKLQQVLLNLLSNAAKFTPRGGRVTLACEDSGDGAVAVRVSDTGKGIPPDKLEAIFEPFVQLDQTFTREAEGTGLGLSISRDMARGMGGDLTAESTVGAGSTFTLTLARADGPPAAAGAPGRAGQNA
jgi:PAS domain S-box-containing protein